MKLRVINACNTEEITAAKPYSVRLWSVEKMNICHKWIRFPCKWYSFFFHTHLALMLSLYLFYVMFGIVTFDSFNPCMLEGMDSATKVQLVSTEQKLKCEAIVQKSL